MGVAQKSTIYFKETDDASHVTSFADNKYVVLKRSNRPPLLVQEEEEEVIKAALKTNILHYAAHRSYRRPYSIRGTEYWQHVCRATFKRHKMRRRHTLTLGFRQEDTMEQEAEKSMQVRTSQFLRGRDILLKQLSATSEPSPAIDLGDLASLLMPPKIVRHDDEE
jgi:hypothetical protein